MTPDPSRDDSYLDSFLETAFREHASDGALSIAESAADETDTVPPELLARYPVAEVLGRGGVGIVYRAHDADLGRDVAIKVLSRRFLGDADAVARFETEARISSRLQHPGVVPIHELGKLEDGRPYFTMKIVQGETLADRLSATRGASGPRALVEIVERVAQTLALAHSHGIVHGDVKPQNVMLGAFGEVQLVDWGFAREIDPTAQTAIGATSRGRVAGTPSYMAPEQARGELDSIGPRSDVFGLGAILCEILTGSPPYAGDSRSEILLRAARGWIDDARERLRDCRADPSLVELTSACLDPDPNRRPHDGAEVARGIHDHIAALETRAKDAELRAAEARAAFVQERKVRRLTLLLTAAAFLALAVPAILVYAAERAQQRRGEIADRALAAASGRARLLLDQARASTNDDAASWAGAIAAANEIRSIASSPDASSESAVAAHVLADAIDHERNESANRAVVLARLDELHPHGKVERPVETDREYVKCFERLGCTIDDTDSQAAIDRLGALPCVDALVDALDELTLIRFHHSIPHATAFEAPRRIAAALDDDPTRARIREALGATDLTTLEDLAKTAPAMSDVRTLNLLARSLVEAGKQSLAVDVYRIASTRHPDHYWTQHDLASLLVLSNPPPHEEIARLYAMALAVRPHHPHALTDLGRSLSLAGKHASAVELLSRAAALDLNDGRIRLLLGATLSSLGKTTAAREEYQRAIDLGNGIAIPILVQSQIRSGDFRSAIATLEKSDDVTIPDSAMRFEIALRLNQIHRPEIAERVIDPVLQSKGTSIDACRFAVHLATERGDFSESRRRFDEANRTHSLDEFDPEGALDRMIRECVEAQHDLETLTTDAILERDVQKVAMAAITAQRLGDHPRAERLHRELFAFDPRLYQSRGAALAFSALRSATVVATGDDAEASARAAVFSYAIANTILDTLCEAERVGTITSFQLLEVLLAIEALEPMTVLRKHRRDEAFETRFEGIRIHMAELESSVHPR